MCSHYECQKVVWSRGLCTYHYNLYKKQNKIKNIYQKRGANKKHALYHTYRNMIARCSNKNNENYVHYGGRGITVCERWLNEDGFNNFANDLGERPPGYELDRVDVNKNYSPKNCRWVDKYTQMANRRISTNHPGVSFMKSRNKWRARIKINRKEIHIGLFDNKEDAIKARNKYKIKHV